MLAVCKIILTPWNSLAFTRTCTLITTDIFSRTEEKDKKHQKNLHHNWWTYHNTLIFEKMRSFRPCSDCKPKSDFWQFQIVS